MSKKCCTEGNAANAYTQKIREKGKQILFKGVVVFCTESIQYTI